MKLFLILIVAAVASTSSFIVHVISAEWLPNWISAQMQNITIQPSWDVRYVAAITSIEYGLASIALYSLAREKLQKFGSFRASFMLSMLLAALHGALIRQPFMDYVVGNPLAVVIVQNSFNWLVWLFMAFIVVFGYELIQKLGHTKQKVE